MNTAGKYAAVVLLFCLLCATTWADIRLPAVFGDGMVLQQRSRAAVWGWAEPGEKVTVKGSWQWLFGTSTTADENGRWQVRINTPRAGGPHSVSIKGNNEIVLNDVLIGEVWVCSGQSNMEWSLDQNRTDESEAAIAAADFPQIRLFNVNRVYNAEPQEDSEGQWQICTPETARPFSAAAFYFGRELHQKLDVPIGLIQTAWGGTPAQAWMSADALREHGDFTEMLDRVENPERYAQADKEEYERDLAAWLKTIDQMDKGIEEGWYSPGFDDSDWNEMELPSLWTDTDLENVDGIVWFRRVTNLPPSWTRGDLELSLGPIDDIDTVWFNGVKLGTTLGWYKPRTYRVPRSALRTGPNRIVVRVIDTGYEGGFGGEYDDMRIGPPGAAPSAGATVARTWTYKVSHRGEVPTLPYSVGQRPLNQNTPTALYNTMLHPLIPFRIAGVIWYQGESNVGRPIQYRTLFPDLIKDWRTQWNQGNFPFYYVQIAPYPYDDPAAPASAFLREAQMMTLQAAPNVGMAVTMDIGDEHDIHPRNKHDVGKRLALWALANTYNHRGLVYSGPIYKSMKVQRDTIRLSFDHVGGGLVSRGGPLVAFEIAGIDRTFVPARAEIQGDMIVVSSSRVSNPVAVRYAFRNWVRPNLFNAEGLPASSFRTDDWPIE